MEYVIIAEEYQQKHHMFPILFVTKKNCCLYYVTYLYYDKLLFWSCFFFHYIIFLFQGWYIITYALGIYLLNLFIAFLTPQVDPAVMEDEGMWFYQIIIISEAMVSNFFT